PEVGEELGAIRSRDSLRTVEDVEAGQRLLHQQLSRLRQVVALMIDPWCGVSNGVGERAHASFSVVFRPCSSAPPSLPLTMSSPNLRRRPSWQATSTARPR